MFSTFLGFRIIFFSLSMQEVEKGNVGLSIICES